MERSPDDASAPPAPASTATGTKRRLFPTRRRALKRQVGELQSEIIHLERQFDQAQAEIRALRDQLLERRRELEQTEHARLQEAAQREAAEASLQAREETLQAARGERDKLRRELEDCRLVRLELETQVEGAHLPAGDREQARRERVTFVPGASSQLEVDYAGGETYAGVEAPEAGEGASRLLAKEQGTGPPEPALRWRVERGHDDQTLRASYGELLQLSLAGERSAVLMQRLQHAAPQLQALAELLCRAE
jgi:TolA-binding protein